MVMVHCHHDCHTLYLFVLCGNNYVWVMGCILLLFFACLKSKFLDVEPNLFTVVVNLLLEASMF